MFYEICTELYLFVLSTIFNSNSILYFTLYKIFTQVYVGRKIKYLINNNYLKDIKFICVQTNKMNEKSCRVATEEEGG